MTSIIFTGRKSRTWSMDNCFQVLIMGNYSRLSSILQFFPEVKANRCRSMRLPSTKITAWALTSLQIMYIRIQVITNIRISTWRSIMTRNVKGMAWYVFGGQYTWMVLLSLIRWLYATLNQFVLKTMFRRHFVTSHHYFCRRARLHWNFILAISGTTFQIWRMMK